MVKNRFDTLGQVIIKHRHGAAHYRPHVPFDENRTRELLGLLCSWLMRDPTSYDLGDPNSQGDDRDTLMVALARYPNFEQSPIFKLRKLMFTDAPLPDEERCTKLLASADLPQIRQKEGKRIGAGALLRVVELEDGPRAALALQYLQPFTKQEHTIKALKKRWYVRETPPALKCHLVWRIGDDLGGDNEFKEVMRSWIFANFAAWSDSAQQFFCSTPDNILVAIQNKLARGAQYPEQKKWIVVCCAPVSANKEAARQLLSKRLSEDNFVESTRKAVLTQFF